MIRLVLPKWSNYDVVSIQRFHSTLDIFFFQGGMYAINLMDWYSVGLGLLVIGIMECVVINYVYGKDTIGCY